MGPEVLTSFGKREKHWKYRLFLVSAESFKQRVVGSIPTGPAKNQAFLDLTFQVKT